jgi:hypothetical protein
MERFCEVHGTHSKWSLRPVKQTWTCTLCRKDQRRTRVIEQNYEALKKLFGKELADQYLVKVRAGEKTRLKLK